MRNRKFYRLAHEDENPLEFESFLGEEDPKRDNSVYNLIRRDPLQGWGNIPPKYLTITPINQPLSSELTANSDIDKDMAIKSALGFFIRENALMERLYILQNRESVRVTHYQI